MKFPKNIKDKMQLDDSDDNDDSNEIEPTDEQEQEFIKSKLPMQFYKFDERLMIFGKTRMGKTYLVKRLINRIKKYRLVIVLDVKLEYDDIPELTDSIFMKKNSKGLYKLTSLDYDEQEINDPFLLCEFLCENAVERKNTTIVLEEVAQYIRKQGKLYDIAPSFAKYLQQAQAFHCGLICTSQRPAEVHTNILSQSQHIISFYMKLPHDREALKEYFDESIYDRLDMYEFVRYQDPDKNFIHYKVY